MSRFLLLVLVLCVGLGCQGEQYNPTYCPESCSCLHPSTMPSYWGYEINKMHVSNGVAMEHCASDPYYHLLTIIERYPIMDGLQITHSLNRIADKKEYLARLFSHLSNLTLLHVLSLAYNDLDVLPDNIGQLSSLRLLDVERNRLKQLPESTGNIPLLESLSVNENSLICLPHKISNLTLLVKLWAYRNNLEELPVSICYLKSLKVLEVQMNKLLRVPVCIGNIMSLERLSFEQNLLTQIPSSIGNLSALRELFLNQNILTKLPMAIGSLKSLVSIEANHNNITSIDFRSLVQVPHIVVDLRYNQISHFTNGNENKSLLNTTNAQWRLDLSHNSLHHLHDISESLHISEGQLVHLITSGNIILSHNPLRCVCEDYNIYQGLHQDPQFTSFSCGIPDSHRVVRQVGLRQPDFRCIINLNCPDGCVCTDIPNQSLLIVDCQNYTGTVLPDKMPSPFRNSSQYRYTLDFQGGTLVNLGNWDYLKKVVNASFSKNRIKEIPMGFFDNTKNFNILKLDNNQINTLPLNIGKWPRKIYLGFNRWRCLCVDKPTIQTIEDNKDKVVDYNDVKCSGPNNQKNKRFIQVINTLCSELNLPFIVVGTLLGVLIMMFTAIGTIYYKRVWVSKRFEWRPFQRDDPDDALKEYDVFVSYANEDHSYIEDELIPRLRELGFKVCHHREHFLAGDSIIDNIHTAIFNSKRTLVYFSQAYKDSGFCMHEFRSALTLHVKNNRSHLITIKDTHIDIRTQETHLQSFFQLFTYIDRDSSKFWDNLLYSLPVNRMNASGNGNAENVVQNEIEMDGQMGDDMAVLIDN